MAQDRPGTEHFKAVVTDHSIGEPWVVGKARPAKRLLLTAPFGRRFVAAGHRVYDAATFRRPTRGYKILSREHYKREGERYVPCQAEDVKEADFDCLKVRSDAVVLAELSQGSGLSHFLARPSLRVRRTWRKLTQRGAFWAAPWTGESAGEWLRKKQAAARQGED